MEMLHIFLIFLHKLQIIVWRKYRFFMYKFRFCKKIMIFFKNFSLSFLHKNGSSRSLFTA